MTEMDERNELTEFLNKVLPGDPEEYDEEDEDAEEE